MLLARKDATMLEDRQLPGVEAFLSELYRRPSIKVLAYTALLAAVGSVLLVSCARQPKSVSCVSNYNPVAAASRATYLRGGRVEALRLWHEATFGLQQCLAATKSRNSSSEARLAEMWLVLGELESDQGHVHLAKVSLYHAKDIFAKLRASGSLHGTLLGEVLLENREAHVELAKLAKRR